MKSLIRTLLREGLLLESKASEQQTLGVLRNLDNKEEILNQLKSVDKSNNQKNLPFMAVFYVGGEDNIKNIGDVFAEYEELVNKNRVKPLTYSKKRGMCMGDKPIAEFIKFSEYIHGETNKYATKDDSPSSVSADFKTEKETLWSGNGIDIYDRARFNDMVDGTAYKPFVYRALVPFTIRIVSEAIPDKIGTSINKYVNRNFGDTFTYKMLHLEIHRYR